MNTTANINQLQAFGQSDVVARILDDAPKWAALALVVVIGWQLSTIIWALLPGQNSVALPRSDDGPAVSAGTSTESSIDVGPDSPGAPVRRGRRQCAGRRPADRNRPGIET